MAKGKNILFLLLLIVILIPMTVPVLLQIKICVIKLEAEEKLETTHLQIIHIRKADIHWTEHGKEMIIDKRLFDVKEYWQKGNDLVVQGLFDDEETALEKQIDNLWNQQNSKQCILLFKYFQILNNAFFDQHSYQLAEVLPAGGTYAREIISDQKDIFIKIPSPPPQV